MAHPTIPSGLRVVSEPGRSRLVDGETVLVAESGHFIHSQAGELSIAMPTAIATVKVADPAEVRRHSVSRVLETVTERFQFHDGGFLEIDRDLSGQVLGFRGEALTLQTQGGDVIARSLKRAPPPFC